MAKKKLTKLYFDQETGKHKRVDDNQTPSELEVLSGEIVGVSFLGDEYALVREHAKKLGIWEEANAYSSVSVSSVHLRHNTDKIIAARLYRISEYIVDL